MPLRKQALPIQFEGGIESKQDEKQVPTTKLLNLENAVFVKATTLAKRNGYEALGGAINTSGELYANATGIAARDDELMLFADGHGLSHRPSSDSWSDCGEVSSVVASGRPHARTGTQQWCPDMATAQGITVTAWEDSRGGIWCEVTEDDTRHVHLPATQLDSSANAVHPRCVVSGGNLMVLWARRDGGQIRIAVINPGAPSETPTTNVLVATLSTTFPYFDAESARQSLDTCFAAVALSGREPAIIAWAESGGGFRIGYIAASGVLGSAVTGLPGVTTFADQLEGPIAVSIERSADTVGVLAVAWASSAGLKFRMLTANDLATFRGPITTGSGNNLARLTCAWGAIGSDGAPVLYWAADQNVSPTHVVAVLSGAALQTTTTLDTLVNTLEGHTLVTRAFHDGTTTTQSAVGTSDGDAFVAVARAVQFFPYVAVVRLSAASFGGESTSVAARLLPGQSAGMHFRRITSSTLEYIRHLSSVQDVDVESGTDGNGNRVVFSRCHRMPLSYRIQLDSENGDQFGETGIVDMTLDFDHPSAWQATQIGRGLYLGGALPQLYDGDRWTEADYHCAPDTGYTSTGVPVALSSLFTASATGGSMSNGAYLYKLWYEDVDASGELHPGPTSVGVLVTLSGGGSAQKVTIDIPQYTLTNKRNASRICVARTEVGATGTDSQLPLRRVTSLDPAQTSGNNGFIINDPGASTGLFVDGMSDATLLTKEPLYTNGGILSNEPAPWCGNVIVGSKGRVFWVDPVDPNLVRFSQQIREDTGLEMSPRLVVSVDPYGGDIVALAALDDAMVVFKETAVYTFGGPGPLANPSADAATYAFSNAELVTSDVGCKSPKSVCQSPVGVVFQSEKGIKLLDRSRQVQDIGGPVYAYNDQTITRATLLPDRHQIMFLTSEGRTLLWDYERNQWSTFTNHEGLDAVVVNGVYHYLRTDGRVFAETPGLYRDDNSHIPMVIETAWIKLAGYLQGWQRILWAYIIGTWKSAHTLSVKWRIDYNAGYSAPVLLDVDTNYNPTDYGESTYGDGPYGGSEGDTTRYQRRIHLNKRCQAIQFRIEDVENTDSFGASFELSELLLIGGILREAFKPGPARTN